MKKKCRCFNCGEDLGEMDIWPDDLPCCGQPECDRKYRIAMRERQDEVEEMARADNYDRYR